MSDKQDDRHCPDGVCPDGVSEGFKLRKGFWNLGRVRGSRLELVSSRRHSERFEERTEFCLYLSPSVVRWVAHRRRVEKFVDLTGGILYSQKRRSAFLLLLNWFNMP
jgi:hypothetical protein